VATFTSASPAETQRIAREFAASLAQGSVVALAGQLGVGKTQFVKGLVAGIGATAEVTSPTFTLIHEYIGGRLPVYHFDFFRIEDREAAERLGLDEYFFGDGVSVVEWADKFRETIPADALWISFETKSENERLLILP
jgi:tRNA threonylcarbamoyladenosine biosynthesis protein TsaE